MRRYLALMAIASYVFVSVATATAPAPSLSARGKTLTWSSVQGSTRYQLEATSGTGKALRFVRARTYRSSSEAPTTKYRVRAYTPTAGKWSNAVKIVNRPPPEEKPHEEKPPEEKPPEEKPEEEKPPEEPEGEEEPARGPITFSPGIVGGYDSTYDGPGAASVGAKLVRIQVEYDHVNEAAIAEAAAMYRAKGITPQILFDFHGTMPTPAAAKGIAALARIPAIKLIEFGNETSYGYQYGEDGPPDASYKNRARTYAQRFVEAAKALAPHHIGLLAQGGDGGTGSSMWVDEMFAAEPELSRHVAGWTVHPYGTGGAKEMERLIADLAHHGDTTIPIDVTEWGIATDNGRALSGNYGFPVNLTYSQAGALLKEWVAKYRAQCAGRLRSFFIYQVRDQQPSGATNKREDYFGLLQHEDQKKVGYTEAVETLMRQ